MQFLLYINKPDNKPAPETKMISINYLLWACVHYTSTHCQYLRKWLHYLRVHKSSEVMQITVWKKSIPKIASEKFWRWNCLQSSHILRAQLRVWRALIHLLILFQERTQDRVYQAYSWEYLSKSSIQKNLVPRIKPRFNLCWYDTNVETERIM